MRWCLSPPPLRTPNTYTPTHTRGAPAAQEAEARAKAAKEEAAKEAAAAKEAKAKGEKGAGKTAAGGTAAKEDPDPQGAALAAVAEPLAEAAKWVDNLKAHAPFRLETHTAAFEVYVRRGRPLLYIAAAEAAQALAGRDAAEAHVLVVRACLAAGTAAAAAAAAAAPPAAAIVKQVADESLKRLLGGCADVSEYCAKWDQRCGDASLPQAAAAAQVAAIRAPSQKTAAAQLLLQRATALTAPSTSGNGPAALAPLASSSSSGRRRRRRRDTHGECVSVHKVLADVLGDAAGAAKWKAHCGQLFRWSTYFEGPMCKVPAGEPVSLAAGEAESTEEGAATAAAEAEDVAAALAKLIIRGIKH